MTFRITGLDPAPFEHLFGLDDEALRKHNAKRYVAHAAGGFPCRVTLADADPGDTLLLVPHRHQTAHSPYASSGAIFVREGEHKQVTVVGEVPKQMTSRLISLRAYDRDGMMVDADVAEGDAIKPLIERLLANTGVDYIHAHFARRGCYAALIERA